MKHAKSIITLISVVLLAIVIADPLLTNTADAAAVLESDSAASANLGKPFRIVARGRAFLKPAEGRPNQTFYVTEMSLEFLIQQRGNRGVLLSVSGGELLLNDSLYVFDEGVGFAARPEEGSLIVAVVFGFRINMTGPNGEATILSFVGGIKRTHRAGPVLIMRGSLTMGDTKVMLAQLGRIHQA